MANLPYICADMAYRQLSEPEFDDIQSRIVYEDNHILVIDKLAGEIVQADRTGDECLAETLKAFIAQRDGKPGNVFMGVPHRLDRPVCGLCIFAKTSKALSRLAEMFRTGDVHKTYWALCTARPQKDDALLEDWLVRNEKQNKSFIVKGHSDAAGSASGKSGQGSGAKLARLRYHYLCSTERFHLLEVELLTGRHHQIRCQLAGMGCPIKGDLKYGAPRSNPDGGICLQAHAISFVHPVRKEPLDLKVPAPSSWKGLKDA